MQVRRSHSGFIGNLIIHDLELLAAQVRSRVGLVAFYFTYEFILHSFLVFCFFVFWFWFHIMFYFSHFLSCHLVLFLCCVFSFLSFYETLHEYSLLDQKGMWHNRKGLRDIATFGLLSLLLPCLGYIFWSIMFQQKVQSMHQESLVSNHDLHVYSHNPMPTLGSLCFNIFKMIQSSREGQGENINDQTNIKVLIYASLKGKPLLLSICQDPSSAHEINTGRCIFLYKIDI